MTSPADLKGGSGDPWAGSAVPKPRLSVAAIVERRDEILLVRRSGGPAGEWSLPAALLDPMETMAEAAVRALAEQAGFDAGLCGPFMGWTELIEDAANTHQVVMFFKAVILDDQPGASGTAIEIGWIPVWKVPELRLVDGLAEFLADQGLIDTVI
ncbi:MAG TPA: NUDIX domain-containing protein [Microthrixaceae bacterium]|nr:NUDIX domain-containing protein [Microthrixaceae bacterium]